MGHFIGFHLRHDGSGGQVVGGELVHVPGQMRLDLALGFHHKAKAELVTPQFACAKANGEGAGVPQGVQERWVAAQLL